MCIVQMRNQRIKHETNLPSGWQLNVKLLAFSSKKKSNLSHFFLALLWISTLNFYPNISVYSHHFYFYEIIFIKSLILDLQNESLETIYGLIEIFSKSTIELFSKWKQNFNYIGFDEENTIHLLYCYRIVIICCNNKKLRLFVDGHWSAYQVLMLLSLLLALWKKVNRQPQRFQHSPLPRATDQHCRSCWCFRSFLTVSFQYIFFILSETWNYLSWPSHSMLSLDFLFKWVNDALFPYKITCVFLSTHCWPLFNTWKVVIQNYLPLYFVITWFFSFFPDKLQCCNGVILFNAYKKKRKKKRLQTKDICF